MATFLFIRHGLNDFTGKKLIGRLPGIHLNEVGENQAVAIADYLRDTAITAIYSSPLERASETALPLARQKNLPIIFHEGLSEVDFGKLQGKTSKQLKNMKIWEIVHNTPTQVQFPGGETLIQSQQRVVSFIEEISPGYGEKDIIACFSHSDIVRLMLANYLCIPMDIFHRLTIDTGSITTLRHSAKGIRVLGMNHVISNNHHNPE